VIDPPDPTQLLQGMVEQILPANDEAAEFADSETDFLLNVR
jgi:hypothetical protein